MATSATTKKTGFEADEKISLIFYEKLIAHVNRKDWWHVPPRDPGAYGKRGKFLASSFKEAEFWGRPLDQPEEVLVARPLVGDENRIEMVLFRKRIFGEDISIERRWEIDAKIKQTALSMGFDSIVLLTPKGFAEFQVTGKVPRSMELNVLSPNLNGRAARQEVGNRRLRS